MATDALSTGAQSCAPIGAQTTVTPVAIRPTAIQAQAFLSRVDTLSDAITRVIDDISCEDPQIRRAVGDLSVFNDLIADQVKNAAKLCEAIEIADHQREKANG